MTILVVYASKHGATQGIAEHVADTLRSAGRQAEVRQATDVEDAGDLAGYEGFVVGSAVYGMHWRKEASRFVRSNADLLEKRPVWLFSSGPLGTETTDADGRDVRDSAEPTELTEFSEAIHPRGHRVFFGVLDPGNLGVAERLMRKLPAARKMLPEGDFRDWENVEGWARGIAEELSRTAESRGRTGP